MENKKHAFWQAFFITLLFFLVGLVLGIYLEQLRTDELNTEFYNSEASLYDSFAVGKITESKLASCDDLRKLSVNFADKIYEEARELEKFDESNELTDSIKSLHRKYDLLRTILWMNIIEIKEKCEGVNSVVYFYVYDTQDIELKSKQVVWNRILGDLKEKNGEKIILIPIAIDQEIESLNYLLDFYDIENFPAVLINEKEILYEHKTIQEIENFLK